jgi:Protein of unknown function (DUF3500)
MKQYLISPISIVFIIFLIIFSCKKTDDTTTTVLPTITELSCTSASFSGIAVASSSYTGTASVGYAGGNGATYATGAAVPSTGVTGLTATLAAGTLASGTGTVTFAITGTPSAAGTASFDILLGGQSCSISMTVSAATTTTTTNGTWAMETDMANIVKLAEAFKATLSASQITSLQDATYNKAHAQKWSNFPIMGYKDRVGLQTNTLSATQWTAFNALLKAATGTGTNEGNEEYLGIMAADDYLHTYSGENFGSGFYYIAYIGMPSTTALWCLQIGGHHGTIIHTYNGGKMTGGTPSFRSTEPYPTWTVGSITYQPVVQETTAFANFLKGLSATELSSAKRASAQNDIIVGPQKDANFPTTKTGIKGSSLSSSQKDLMLAAIKTYVDDLDDKAAAAVLIKYKAEIDETFVSYYGGTTMAAKGDYILIDGPSVWIEWSMQAGATIKTSVHPHSVWRDRKSDYGAN